MKWSQDSDGVQPLATASPKAASAHQAPAVSWNSKKETHTNGSSCLRGLRSHVNFFFPLTSNIFSVSMWLLYSLDFRWFSGLLAL